MVENISGQQEQAAEFERQQAITQIIADYFPEDTEYYAAVDTAQNLIGELYGALLELGEDPDIILAETGLLEEELGEGEEDEV